MFIYEIYVIIYFFKKAGELRICWYLFHFERKTWLKTAALKNNIQIYGAIKHETFSLNQLGADSESCALGSPPLIQVFTCDLLHLNQAGYT